MSGLFNLFIRNIRIDWPRIERHSYLRNIPAIAGLEEIATMWAIPSRQSPFRIT